VGSSNSRRSSWAPVSPVLPRLLVMGPAVPGLDTAALRTPGAAPGLILHGKVEEARARRAVGAEGRAEQRPVAPAERLHEEPIKPSSLAREPAAQG